MERDQGIAALRGRVAELEADLRACAEGAAARDADFERFVYSVSHDLQEPLRMVVSYVQLLARRYAGRLDADADDFIGYAVDGGQRMRAMLEGLLRYSRIASQGKPMAPVALESVWARVLDQLQDEIGASGAVVTHAPLPVVEADEAQLALLLRQLLDNALKFRGEAAPRIHLSCVRRERDHLFGVRDNGMGIAPGDAERVFTIFQRLRPGATQPGTGMGLALCRRVVERHHGRIWVEPAPESGATFFFTLPATEAHTS